MKTFESLFAELSEKAQTRPEGSLTVDELDKGTHFIGKKESSLNTLHHLFQNQYLMR